MKPDLLLAIALLEAEELPAVLAALAARMATVPHVTATEGKTTKGNEADVEWIGPEKAARIAGLDVSTPEATRRAIRRIYSWAAGQRWASRPSRRCLRISERGFRRWLEARK